MRKEKEEGKREREEIEAEKKDLEWQKAEEKKLCEKASERAQERIAELEEENKHLKGDALEKKKLLEKQEAASKTAEEKKAQEQNDCEKKREAEAKKVISKLEEVLNGRKLIGNLQSDQRRDRQLLLELRAQLVRPTYAAPPSHMNPLRFGGSALQAAYRAPVIPTPSAASTSTSPPARPKVNLPPTFPFNSPQATDRFQSISSGAAVNQDVGFSVASLPPRPVVCLPSRAPPRSPIIPPPPSAPKGPKGWRPDTSGRPK